MPLDRLLWRLRDHEQIGRYVEDARPGARPRPHQPHPLLATLEALCANGGRRAEAARALHLNRQALYDRIARLEQLTRRDLDDPEALLTLQLALRANKLLGGERSADRRIVARRRARRYRSCPVRGGARGHSCRPSPTSGVP